MAERVAKQRFLALRVNEVSLVGSPANEEEFITVKSTDPEEQPVTALPEADAVEFKLAKVASAGFFGLAVSKGFNPGQPRKGDGKWSGGGITAGPVGGGSATTVGGEAAPGHSGEAPSSNAGTKTVPTKVAAPKVTEHKGETGGTYKVSEHQDGTITVNYHSPKYPNQPISFDKKYGSHAEAKAAMDKHEEWRKSKGAKAPQPKAGGVKGKLSTTITKQSKNKEQTMAGETQKQTVTPVAKDVAVGDEWVPMCMGRSCDSLSNICRACPAKVLCSELCHMNVPPDEPNTQEASYKPTPAAAAVAEGLFPNGGQQTTKENKPMETTPATTPPAAPAAEVQKSNETPAPAPTTTTEEVAKAGKMQDHDACKGKGCKDCNDSGKVPVAKAEEPAKEEPTAKGKPQFSEERLEALRKSLESIAGIMKEVDPEGFNKLMGQLGSGPKTPIAPTTVASPVSVAKEDMEAIIAKTLAPFKEEIASLGKKVEEVAQVRGVSKSLTTEEPTAKGTQQAQPFWKGVL